jgi:hypothetical protein
VTDAKGIVVGGCRDSYYGESFLMGDVDFNIRKSDYSLSWADSDVGEFWLVRTYDDVGLGFLESIGLVPFVRIVTFAGIGVPGRTVRSGDEGVLSVGGGLRGERSGERLGKGLGEPLPGL